MCERPAGKIGVWILQIHAVKEIEDFSSNPKRSTLSKERYCKRAVNAEVYVGQSWTFKCVSPKIALGSWSRDWEIGHSKYALQEIRAAGVDVVAEARSVWHIEAKSVCVEVSSWIRS